MHPLKGKKQTAEHIQKRVNARKGFRHSFESIEKIKEARSKQIITNKTRKRMSVAQKKIGNRPPILYGKDNPTWKGNKVTYRALHMWIERNLGIPKLCSKCGTKKAKRFHWANISGKYNRDLNDWKRLCATCHANEHQNWRFRWRINK